MARVAEGPNDPGAAEVTRARQRAPMLEVAVLHPRDVAGADEGGADRVVVFADPEADPEAGGRSPEPSVVSSVCKGTDVAVRVVLRLSDGFSTTGAEVTRLLGLAEDYLAVGASGLVFGFLDLDLEVDVEPCLALAGQLRGVPWTFSRAIDSSLAPERAWRQMSGLPGLDSVLSAGSPQGMGTGFDDLIRLAESDERVASLLVAGGGLRAEQVPWLVRAGVTAFHLGSSARQDGSWSKAYVDAGRVRSWRMLLDDAAGLAAGLRPA